MSVLSTGSKRTSCRSAGTLLRCCAQANASSHSTGLIIWLAVADYHSPATSGSDLSHVWTTSSSGRVISYLSPSVHSVHSNSVWKRVQAPSQKNTRFFDPFLPTQISLETIQKKPTPKAVLRVKNFPLTSKFHLTISNLHSFLLRENLPLQDQRAFVFLGAQLIDVDAQRVIIFPTGLCYARLNKSNSLTIIFCEGLSIPSINLGALLFISSRRNSSFINRSDQKHTHFLRELSRVLYAIALILPCFYWKYDSSADISWDVIWHFHHLFTFVQSPLFH